MPIFIEGSLRKVVKVSPDGVIIANYQNADLKSPRGIDADANGNVFVLNLSENKLFKFDSGGQYVATQIINFGGDQVTIDELSNTLYVAGSGISAYDVSGAGPVYQGKISSLHVDGINFDSTLNSLFATPFDLHPAFDAVQYTPTGDVVAVYQGAPIATELSFAVAAVSIPEPELLVLMTAALFSLGLTRHCHLRGVRAGVDQQPSSRRISPR
jgi:hypothetical protein